MWRRPPAPLPQVPALGDVGFSSVINGPTIWTGDSLPRCGRTRLPGCVRALSERTRAKANARESEREAARRRGRARGGGILVLSIDREGARGDATTRRASGCLFTAQ